MGLLGDGHDRLPRASALPLVPDLTYTPTMTPHAYRVRSGVIVGGELAILLLSCFGVGACDEVEAPPPPSRAPRSVRIAYDGTGDFPTIQAAINSSIDGDTILLENGRFTGQGNRDLDFKGIRLILQSERNSPDFCVIDCEGTEADPHRGLAFRNRETASTVIAGITIENGYGHDGGGAIVLEQGSSPTFRNLIVRSHESVAVRCTSSSPVFENCVFSLNSAGAILATSSSSLSFVGCIFVDNFSSGSGAAIAIVSSAVSTTNCEFLRNGSSFSGGAIYSTSGSTERAHVDAVNCFFVENISGYHGGAIDVSNTELSLEGSVLARNTAGQNGGALWIYSQSMATIASSVFHDNNATRGSAINCGAGSVASIVRTIVTANRGSAPVLCDSVLTPPVLSIACSDVFGNEVGDWLNCIAGELGVSGNLSADPLFCDPVSDDFGLQLGSPCLPPASQCGPMGIPSACENGRNDDSLRLR